MKPRILVLAEYYLPGYRAGGPVRSVSNLVAQLYDDYEWLVVTRDRDHHTRTPYPGIVADRWTRVGPAAVFYSSPSSLGAGVISRLLRETAHDAVYINSFFSPRFSVLPQWSRQLGLAPRRPLLLAPRGEFAPGALNLKSLKKRLYLKVARLTGSYADALWHASSEWEADDIARATGAPRSRIFVARNLAPLSDGATTKHDPEAARRRPGALRICYLARVARNKNLAYALEILSRIRCTVVFTIHGPQEDPAYWAECQTLIERLPPNIDVRNEGPVPHERVTATLAEHDLFFLPSAGENFGHVLVEAWTAGLPVLTSDRTPWRGLQTESVGWDLPLDDPIAFASVIEEVAQWPPERRATVSLRCREFALQHARNEAAIEANRRMFRWVLETSRVVHASEMV
jgi:glycosyltransferase involved in cell wall biosynthesis